MMSDIITRTDNRLRLITSILALTGYSETEQRIESYEPHPIFLETIKWLEPYKEYRAISSMRDVLNSGVNPSPFFNYSLALSWPGFQFTELPDSFTSAKSGAIESDYNIRLKEFYNATRIAELWEKQKSEWKNIEEDAERALDEVPFKSWLNKIFGSFDEKLVFYPNPIVPRLSSASGLNKNEFFCIIRLPVKSRERSTFEPVDISDGETIGSYSDNSVWTKISAFHEFTRLLLNINFNRDREHIDMAKVIAAEKPVLEQYRVSYHEWENMFEKFITFGFTYLLLEEIGGIKTADAYMESLEKKTGVTILPSLVDGLREYFEKHSTGEITNITTYLPELLKRF